MTNFYSIDFWTRLIFFDQWLFNVCSVWSFASRNTLDRLPYSRTSHTRPLIPWLSLYLCMGSPPRGTEIPITLRSLRTKTLKMLFSPSGMPPPSLCTQYVWRLISSREATEARAKWTGRKILGDMWEAENRADHEGPYTRIRWNITERIITKEWHDVLYS